jgi:glycosyltransferase involved in cell wall biosynthesis
MFDGRTVSVVFPAYNEEASIGEAVRSFLALDEVDEIVVVDNNSRDRTAELAREAGGRVVTETKQGYGHALQRGLAEATGDLVVMAEPDGTFIGEDVRKLLAYVDNADLVLGTRTTREMVWAGANMGFMLRWGNWGVAKLLQVLFNTPSLSDCGCTMRLIHKPALERIRGNLTVGSSHFLPEMVILARLAGLTMIEVPVTYRPRRGESKITGSFKTSTQVAVNMIRIILRYRVSGPQQKSRDA